MMYLTLTLLFACRIGETPLHAACRVGDEGLVALLLQKGADITIRGENGTPLTIAKEEKHEQIVSALQSTLAVCFDSSSDRFNRRPSLQQSGPRTKALHSLPTWLRRKQTRWRSNRNYYWQGEIVL